MLSIAELRSTVSDTRALSPCTKSDISQLQSLPLSKDKPICSKCKRRPVTCKGKCRVCYSNDPKYRDRKRRYELRRRKRIAEEAAIAAMREMATLDEKLKEEKGGGGSSDGGREEGEQKAQEGRKGNFKTAQTQGQGQIPDWVFTHSWHQHGSARHRQTSPKSLACYSPESVSACNRSGINKSSSNAGGGTTPATSPMIVQNQNPPHRHHDHHHPHHPQSYYYGAYHGPTYTSPITMAHNDTFANHHTYVNRMHQSGASSNSQSHTSSQEKSFMNCLLHSYQVMGGGPMDATPVHPALSPVIRHNTAHNQTPLLPPLPPLLSTPIPLQLHPPTSQFYLPPIQSQVYSPHPWPAQQVPASYKYVPGVHMSPKHG